MTSRSLPPVELHEDEGAVGVERERSFLIPDSVARVSSSDLVISRSTCAAVGTSQCREQQGRQQQHGGGSRAPDGETDDGIGEAHGVGLVLVSRKSGVALSDPRSVEDVRRPSFEVSNIVGIRKPTAYRGFRGHLRRRSTIILAHMTEREPRTRISRSLRILPHTAPCLMLVEVCLSVPPVLSSGASG